MLLNVAVICYRDDLLTAFTDVISRFFFRTRIHIRDVGLLMTLKVGSSYCELISLHCLPTAVARLKPS